MLRSRATLLAAIAAGSFGVFVKLTSELAEGELDPLDRAVLAVIAANRSEMVDVVAVDITSLGSVTVLSLLLVAASMFLAFERRWRILLHLVLAAGGAASLSLLFKRLIERERPDVVGRLVEVSGFSYPSGHALASTAIYLTLALLATRITIALRERVAAAILAILVVLAIGSSRMYLGVHYPSDVAAGMLLGTSWALLVSALLDFEAQYRRRRDQRSSSST